MLYYRLAWIRAWPTASCCNSSGMGIWPECHRIVRWATAIAMHDSADLTRRCWTSSFKYVCRVSQKPTHMMVLISCRKRCSCNFACRVRGHGKQQQCHLGLVTYETW